MSDTKIIVDIVVESGDAGHFVVLKADGHELDRTGFTTKEAATSYGNQLAVYAKEKVAEIEARARGASIGPTDIKSAD